MSTAEDIKRKIKALLNKTIENGCTEDEAESAMRMAMGLMARHGIEQSQLGGETPKAKRGTRQTQAFRKHQTMLAMAAASLYGCKVVLYDRGKSGLEFIGRPENIDAAETTFFFLLSQVEHLYKVNLPRGLTQKLRAEYRASFKENCAYRVHQRAAELMRKVQNDAATAQATTGSTALVVQDHFKTLLTEADQILKEMGTRVLKPLSIKQGYGAGDGRTAGDKVQLRRELR
jgi:hypothetical protein